ncbi:GGDEF domain-containing protein [Modestobacter sp. Leaf380]|uniref:GGDEF domain-containing protein n=1 Tax=Modestobacter sp. Leaf380 TaxID=1736356 RepID=UPI0006FF179F|nr:GGDEF domain-containing protein [Modestobacter sp. Leaf380]KQS66531.1 hypothetical protein ASG41_08515 [Modestobacter sp. Leaf380]
MTTLLDGPRTSTPPGAPDTDAVTLLPGRAALLDVLALRRPVAGSAVSGLVVLGLVRDTAPLGAGTLVAVSDALAGVLLEGEWLARCGPAEFAVVTDDVPEDAATRLLGALEVPAAAGVSPGVPGRDAVEVLRLAALGLAIARVGAPGRAVRYP